MFHYKWSFIELSEPIIIVPGKPYNHHARSPIFATPFYSFYELNMFPSLFYLLGLLVLAHAIPLVQIGNTTLIGLYTPGLNVDFFGGMIYTILLCVVRGSRFFYRDSLRQASPR